MLQKDKVTHSIRLTQNTAVTGDLSYEPGDFPNKLSLNEINENAQQTWLTRNLNQHARIIIFRFCTQDQITNKLEILGNCEANGNTNDNMWDM